MRARVVLIPLLTLLGLAAALELAARVMSLDERQRQAIQIEEDLLLVNMPGAPGADWGVDFLPRGFQLDAGGFTSVWGRCDYDHPGPSALVFGDSVTRQVSLPPTPGATSEDPAYTWPGLWSAALGPDWQVCVIAEDGYHPSDYAAMAARVLPELQPERLVVQLCENDLVDVIAPSVEPLPGGGVALYSPVREYSAFGPLYAYWLFARSEAFRFIHWRLQARLGQRVAVPVDFEVHRSMTDALRALEGRGARFFYVPSLEDPPQPPQGENWLRLKGSGVSVEVLTLPQPMTRLRHAPDDPVHLNWRGQAAVYEAAQEAGVLSD